MSSVTRSDRADREAREIAWLEQEVARTAHLTDAERIAILEDLWTTVELIRATKSMEQLRREELARRRLDAPGLERYRALVARLR